VIQLRGKINEVSAGGTTRKKDQFVMMGLYFDGATPRVIAVRGYYHTGKLKQTGSGGQTDDRVCFRVRDRALRFGGGELFAPAMEEPCDEQPPDEDVLNEDDAPGDDPPYDG
jgi:hypothetical protein